MEIWQKHLEETIDRALAEDLGWGDTTTRLLIPPHLSGKASLIVKAQGIIAGIEVAAGVFRQVDPRLLCQPLVADGTRVRPGDVIATLEGAVASILQAERVALNFLQHLSGIASETARYVEAVKGLPVFILDTRKTTPGLRLLEKYAVRTGGGRNHRMHLEDGILIKDNHLSALRSQGKSLKESLDQIRQKAPHTLKIEVEAKTLEEVQETVAAGADIIMLDNMSREEMSRAVALIRGKALIEASGGVTLEKVRGIAETGVNFISIGALTHSAKALDISLELEPVAPATQPKENTPEEDSSGQTPQEEDISQWRQEVQSQLERLKQGRGIQDSSDRFEISLWGTKNVPRPRIELDLHGFTVAEALLELDRYLHEAYAAGLPFVRVVHGKGTGTLRQAIREQLPRHPRVKSFRPATPDEGGAGATVIELVA